MAALAWALFPALALAQDVEAPPPPPPPPPQKASLAVMPFGFRVEVIEEHSSYLKLAIREFKRTGLTNKFVGALVNSRKFDVVERQKVDALLDEMNLSEGGIVDRARAVKAGKMIGADYFLMGEVAVFSVRVLWKAIPYSKTGKSQRIVTAHIVADMRIVDTRTSKIVAAEKGEVTWRQAKMFPNRFDDGQIPTDLVDQLQRQLADDLVERTVDRIYPIKVTGVRAGSYFLNRGLGGGVEVGQVLDVYQVGGEAIVDMDTGEALGFTEIKLGQLRVVEVLPRMCRAIAHSSMRVAFPKGSICRKVKAAATSRPAPVRRRPPGW